MQWILCEWRKAYLHWGHDISPGENPFEAGLGFAVKLNKEYNFNRKRKFN